jgi:tripartite-type tricarboxylate transporter receptor subunit TctC
MSQMQIFYPNRTEKTMRLFRFLGLILLVACSSAGAQAYPDKSKPIKIVVPFGAGSATDLMARAIARAMSEKAGVNAIVDNKPGAEGVIGMQAVKYSPADGYTMVLANISTQVLNVHMLPKLPYDPVADFVPITGIAKFSLVLNATSGLPFKTSRELIEAAKKNPGKYRYGSATTMTRLAMEMLEHVAGIQLLQVPYKSMAEATTALVSGEVDLVMNDAATATAFYQSGRVHPLAATGAARMAGLPNVPTLREQGLADYELTGWLAMYFPAKTPPAVVAAMRDILREAVKSSYVAEARARASYEPLELSGDQVAALQRADSEKFGKLVRAAGLQPR